MKNAPFVALCSMSAVLAALPAMAQVKNCEELRSEIAARTPLRADQQLRIVERDAVDGGTVYGSCEGGTRRILLVSGVTPAEAAPAPAPTPAPGGLTVPAAVTVPVTLPVTVPAKPEPAEQPEGREPPSAAATEAPARTLPGGNEGFAQYKAWIAEARTQHPYSESEEHMLYVMMCESRGNAGIASPAGHVGLFQYSPSTWNRDWNPYKAEDLRDARAQIFATARAWELRYQSWWPTCYRKFSGVAQR